MATPIPFRWITGLPVEAQKELERNFLALQVQITGGVSLFDAIIDPALAASNATAHQYKNITDFTVGETLSTTRSFYVGVIGRPGTPVVETSNITLAGPVTFVGTGPSTAAAFAAPSNRPVIDFAGHGITNTKWVSFVGIELNSTSSIGTLISGPAYFDNCVVDCSNAGAGQEITTVSGGSVWARSTSFYTAGAIGANLVYCTDCVWSWPVAGGSIGASSGTLIWVGGSFDVISGSSPTLSFSGTANVYVRSTFNTSLTGGSSGTRTGVSITSSGTSYVEIETIGNPPDLTVGAGAGDVIVRGFYESVTVSGNTNHHTRKIDVLHSNGTLDVTGPCEITANIASGSSSPKVILRGEGVNAILTLDRPTGTPWLALAACLDSMIVASFTNPASSGNQAYTIDSSSARCLLVLAGTSHSNFSVASTNSGTNCRVMTEVADSLSVSGVSPEDYTMPFLFMGG